MKTGIFLPYFSGQRLKDFPQALAHILDKENVVYYDGMYASGDTVNHLNPVPLDILYSVHSAEMIDLVKSTGYFEAALYSAGGTVQAAEKIFEGNIDNAFVFTGFGDHHAGKNFFGGYCYFNGAALAIAALVKKGLKRFAIVDTDSHHADGTRDIFNRNQDVLHICFCSQDFYDQYSNVDIAVPYITVDEQYLEMVRTEFVPRVNAFCPELIFWEFGYDNTIGEYGDKGLTMDCHYKIADIIKDAADEICHGRLIAILCGGSSRDVAKYTIPKVIANLAGADHSIC